MLLADEIHNHPEDASNTVLLIKQIAFSRIAQEDDELMNAQIQLIRGELLGAKT